MIQIHRDNAGVADERTRRLVSGAAAGLGRAMALALAEAGADLMLADREVEGLHKTAEQIRGFGRQAVPVTCDVSAPEQIRAMFTQLDREFGHIDFLGNVAGDTVLGAPEEISRQRRTHVAEPGSRTFLLLPEAGRRMLAAGAGAS